MVAAVLLDPALLAIPNMAKDEVEVERIFEIIVEWAGRVGSRWPVCVCQPSSTAEELALAGAFPAGNSIRTLIDMCNLNHVYSVEDIRRAIVTILDRSEMAFDRFGVEVRECSSATTTPDILGGYTPEHMRGSAACVLGTAAMVPDSENVFVIPGVLTDERSVVFECRAINAICSDAGRKCPSEVVSEIALVRSYDDVLDRIAPADVWSAAVDAREFALAIALEAAELGKTGIGRRDLRSLRPFYVGVGFVQSLVRYGATGSGELANVTREACARIVLGHPKNEVGYLHDGSGRPISRGAGELARRTHVTKHGMGLRLHFWECGERLEFANVGAKSELWIEAGVPEGAIKSIMH